MHSFAITTLGCKVNQYESQQIRQLLQNSGFTLTGLKQNPELVIINSCCVTHSASAKSRQYIQRAQKLNPQSVVVVCGCLASTSFGELGDVNENVCVLGDRNSLVSALRRIICLLKTTTDLSMANTFNYNHIKAEIAHKIKAKNDLDNNLKLPLLTSFEGHTRAFLKIQNGCNGYCSYCIIPHTRPDVRSKPLKIALREARSLIESGHKEIVLTGVFLGSYGQDTVIRRKWPGQRNDQLVELLYELAQIKGLERIRLSSLEPADITERLLDVFCQNHNIMPHLHLSLQSGSDDILKKMRRQYRAGQFEETVEMVKERLWNPAITADIIVGFPGETEMDFEKTVTLAEKTGFSKMHVFPFSARKGTAAAKMKNRVTIQLMKKRLRRMHQLDEMLKIKFRRQFINREVMVLMESSGYGRCERYFKVYLDDESLKANDLIKVRIRGEREDGAVGDIL